MIVSSAISFMSIFVLCSYKRNQKPQTPTNKLPVTSKWNTVQKKWNSLSLLSLLSVTTYLARFSQDCDAHGLLLEWSLFSGLQSSVWGKVSPRESVSQEMFSLPCINYTQVDKCHTCSRKLKFPGFTSHSQFNNNADATPHFTVLDAAPEKISILN